MVDADPAEASLFRGACQWLAEEYVVHPRHLPRERKLMVAVHADAEIDENGKSRIGRDEGTVITVRVYTMVCMCV